MADVKETPDKIRERLDESRRKSEELGKKIDEAEKTIRPPKPAPDHDDGGGIF